MRLRLPTGIHARLLALIVLACVPAVGIALLNSMEMRRSSLEAVRNEIFMDVAMARDELTLGIRAAGHLLRALSEVPHVVRAAPAGCALFREMAEAEDRFAAFFITDATGRGICGSSAQHSGMDYSDRDYFKSAVQTGKLAIGHPVIGRALRRPLLGLAYPVLSGGQTAAVLVAALDLPWYGSKFSRTLRHDESSLSIWDATGHLLYRYPDSETWTGTRPEAPIARAVVEGTGFRTIESVGVDGINRLYAAASLADFPELGLTLTIGVSKDALDASARQQFLRALAMIAIAALIAAAGSFWLAERLVGRPVARLVEASRRLERGDDDACVPEPHPTGELGTLIAAFNKGAAASRTQRVELERLVRERTSGVEAANQELEAFSYSVSHDLRAPLRHIAGYAELLAHRLQQRTDAEVSGYLNAIGEAIREMNHLIESLLLLSRYGTAGMHREHVDVESLVREAAAKLQNDLAGRQIEWRLAPLPPVIGDYTLLSIVFGNLLDNAVKYTRDADRAVIEVGCCGTEDDFAVIFVRDNGVGFDMRAAGRLFGAFQRLHAASEFPGTGIGLATVRRIVVRHGGRVWSTAAPGKGATFYVTLREARAQDKPQAGTGAGRRQPVVPEAPQVDVASRGNLPAKV